jgi:hypothetical protein
LLQQRPHQIQGYDEMNLNELEKLAKESEYLSDEDIKPKDILALIALVREMGNLLSQAPFYTNSPAMSPSFTHDLNDLLDKYKKVMK